MDTISTKRKRLNKNDSDIDDEEEEPSSQILMSDRKVSFAASSKEPSIEPTAPPSIEPTPSLLDPVIENTNTKKKEPRLVMKKMVLNNFKSYAGRQVIGPFHKVKKKIVNQMNYWIIIINTIYHFSHSVPVR
jgi:hypothetical protein